MMTTAEHILTAAAPATLWWAARTQYGRELGVRDRLVKDGIEHFIPTTRRRNCRGRNVEHPLVPCLVFIRAGKREACSLKTERCYPINYLFDYTRHTMLSVPDKQMDDFRRVYETVGSEEDLSTRAPLALGDRVRIVRGPLAGVEGNVIEMKGRTYVVVGLCGSLFARTAVRRSWIEEVS